MITKLFGCSHQLHAGLCRSDSSTQSFRERNSCEKHVFVHNLPYSQYFRALQPSYAALKFQKTDLLIVLPRFLKILLHQLLQDSCQISEISSQITTWLVMINNSFTISHVSTISPAVEMWGQNSSYRGMLFRFLLLLTLTTAISRLNDIARPSQPGHKLFK